MTIEVRVFAERNDGSFLGEGALASVANINCHIKFEFKSVIIIFDYWWII